MDAVGNIILQETSIDYDMSFIFDFNWEDYQDTSIHYQVRRLQHIHEPYGGLPITYTDNNTLIYQRFLTREEIDYDTLGDQVGIDVYTVSVIKQKPGNTIPLHIDRFYKLKQQNPECIGEPVRANIFVEDWKWGHVIQFEDSLKSNWKKNTGWIFNEHVLHLSSNCGMQDKYTLQLSGFFK
jgi:hypothetical protein